MKDAARLFQRIDLGNLLTISMASLGASGFYLLKVLA